MGSPRRASQPTSAGGAAPPLRCRRDTATDVVTVQVTAARWVAVWAVSYNLLHHLGALPDGLGQAGGGTRWVDWITLLTPYAVVGSAIGALRVGGANRLSWIAGLIGACLYVQGHGINLAANSISNARGGEAPAHLWDEIIGHWLWYGGVALLVFAVARTVEVRARPTAVLLAVASGLTWTTNALEGTTVVGSLAVASAFALWGWSRRAEGTGRLLLVARDEHCAADGLRVVAPGLPSAERARMTSLTSRREDLRQLRCTYGNSVTSRGSSQA